MRWGWIALFALFAVIPARGAGDLATPVRVRAGEKAIDVAECAAAPLLADLGGGSKSLLIGQGDGRLRIYANISASAKKAQPRFDSFSWFQDGQATGRVSGTMDDGFTPLVVDLDGDGIPDLISGSAGGSIYFFKGKGDGKFEDGMRLKDKDNGTISVGKATAVFAYDWTSHGMLDLIVGTASGSIYLIPNEGSVTKYAFGKPKRIQADDQAIQIASGFASPVVADWDSDGKPDLLVGTGAGSVVWYRNTGSSDKPNLTAAGTVVAESPLAKNANAKLHADQWGLRARIAVVDWNGAGRAELLLGDMVPRKHTVTPADREAERRARHDLETLQRDYQSALKKVQELEKVPAKETAKAQREREKKLQSLRKSVAKMQRDEALAQRNVNRLAHPVHYDGRVWLFPRQASPGESKLSN